jgi:large subunit ribosomal protein L21
MFAVIKTGGKQYKVAANDIIKIEKLQGDLGEVIEFTDVLIMGKDGDVKLGSPLLANTKVQATILDQIRDDKVIIFKKNRRHNYRRKNGHRQFLTVVQITDLLPEGAKPSAKPAPAKVAKKEEVITAQTSTAKEATPQKAVKKEATSKEPAKKAAPKIAKEAPTKAPKK